MDESEPSDRSVSQESGQRDPVDFHTPLGGSPRRQNHDEPPTAGCFRTPLDSPLKDCAPEMHLAHVLHLSVPVSPVCSVLSSDSGSEDNLADRSVGSGIFLVPPKPPSRGSSSSSKFLLSESPASSRALSDREESPPTRPNLPHGFANDNESPRTQPPVPPRKLINFTPPEQHRFLSQYAPAAVTKRPSEPVPNFTFSLDEEGDSPEHVLKKFTLSAEFQQLKDAVNTDIEMEKQQMVEPAKSLSRKGSLIFAHVKSDLLLARKSSLDMKVPPRISPEFYERLSTRKSKKAEPAVAEMPKATEDSRNSNARDDVKFINMNTSKPPAAAEVEEPWSLKNLQIVEPAPIADQVFNTEYILPYDLPKSKKPSTRLGNLLEYGRKQKPLHETPPSRNPFVDVASAHDPIPFVAGSNPFLLNSEPVVPDEDIPLLRSSASPPTKIVSLSPKTKHHFTCCIQQPPDLEQIFRSEKHIELVDKEAKKESDGRRSRDKRKAKKKHCDDNGCYSKSGHKSRPTKSSSSDNAKDKQKYRADQAYCDILKQQHEDIRKQRGARLPRKVTKSESGGSSHSDLSLGVTVPSAGESLYDFNLNTATDQQPPSVGLFEFDGEPYSKKVPTGPPTLERIESIYENRKPALERIDSLYDNQHRDAAAVSAKPSKVTSFQLPPFSIQPQKEETPPKPQMTVVPASWWPVVEQEPVTQPQVQPPWETEVPSPWLVSRRHPLKGTSEERYRDQAAEVVALASFRMSGGAAG